MNTSKIKTLLSLAIVACLISVGCETEREAESENENHNHDHNEQTSIVTQTVAGTVSGFDCAVVGVLCPSTHRGADYTNGLFTESEEFYFVVNIPQSYLRQYFLEDLEVIGQVYPGYQNAVEPEEIHLLEEGEKKLVYESGYFIDPQGHRALFNEGRMVDGVWLCENCAGEE